MDGKPTSSVEVFLLFLSPEYSEDHHEKGEKERERDMAKGRGSTVDNVVVVVVVADDDFKRRVSVHMSVSARETHVMIVRSPVITPLSTADVAIPVFVCRSSWRPLLLCHCTTCKCALNVHMCRSRE